MSHDLLVQVAYCSSLDDMEHTLLLQGTIEEKIYQRQTAKQGLSGTVADAKETVKVEFSRDELKVSIQSDRLFLTLCVVCQDKILMRFVVRATEHYLVSEWHFPVVLFIMPYIFQFSWRTCPQTT